MIKELAGRQYLVLRCNKVEQPIGSLYSTSMPWQHLKKIAINKQRIFVGYDDDGKEIYSGIQREVSKSREEDIATYIKTSDANFPTAIILNIPYEKVLVEEVVLTYDLQIDLTKDSIIKSEFSALDGYSASFNETSPVLLVPYEEGVAQVIDGQHRMSGFNSQDSSIIFDLPVTIFLDQMISEQAEIFATINGKQTRVTPSLVYELFGISDTRSPYTVARQTVKLLNETKDSPLNKTIKILGKANERYNGLVTQSTVAKTIIKLISGNARQAEADKDLSRKGQKLTEATEFSRTTPPLRKYFVNEKDEIVFKVILNFFKSVSKVFAYDWDSTNSVLKKTIGFTALIKLMSKLISQGVEEQDLSEAFFSKQLESLGHIKFDNIPLSSKGVKELVDRFNA
ncbi:DGQHR domain-containing protein [Hymenobacter algoricola]|uniref:DGQHR domain-containing protein n=1 Tax=Hymenobacter algoricola TaxID=486267 RepID=A0ABP7N342_9BACT